MMGLRQQKQYSSIKKPLKLVNLKLFTKFYQMYVLLKINGFAKFIERTYLQPKLNMAGKSDQQIQLNYKERLENICVDKNAN